MSDGAQAAQLFGWTGFDTQTMDTQVDTQVDKAFIDEVRDYYGEDIALYLAFMVMCGPTHLTLDHRLLLLISSVPGLLYQSAVCPCIAGNHCVRLLTKG